MKNGPERGVGTSYLRSWIIKSAEEPVLRAHFQVGQVTASELQHRDGQYIRIWGPLGSKEMDEGYGIRGRIPDAFPIGDDGGGRVILYHDGASGPGLYHVGYGNLDSEDAIWIRRDLPSLLGGCSGIEGF